MVYGMLTNDRQKMSVAIFVPYTIYLVLRTID
jgi:hypothetical protein